jgi:tetratricopeptide (TPR) repeat protein
MVQEVLKSRIPPERRPEWIALSLRLVTKYAPGDADDVRTWPVWDLLRPHAAEVPDHPKVANDLSNLAMLLQDTNRPVEAELLMHRALRIDEASFGTDHPEVAADLNNLARLLYATNRLAEAEPLMRRALWIDEASFGIDHPEVATDLNNLAQVLHNRNRLADAEPLMRRALQIDEASFGTDHPRVATDLTNLARLLFNTNRLAEAESLMLRALQIDEASFGPNHPDVAIDPQQPRTAPSGHESAGQGRATDAQSPRRVSGQPGRGSPQHENGEG